jgi:hypothetical protein
MADPFKKVRAGDRFNGSISADLYNLLVDMAQRYVREQRGDFHAPPSKGPGDLSLRIQNATPSPGIDLPQYAVVGIGAPLVVPAETDTSFFGATYFGSAAPVAGQPFAILQRPATCGTFDGKGNVISPGDIQPALVVGMTFAMVDIGTVGDGFADCGTGNYANLFSNNTGVGQVQILWTETQLTGVQWTLVRFLDVGVASQAATTTTIFDCLDGSLYTITLTNGIVTNVVVTPACCGSGGGGSGGSGGGAYVGSIGFSLGCGYSIACMGLPAALDLPYCLTYDGVVGGFQQWSYTASGVSIVVNHVGCIWWVSATFGTIVVGGWYLDPTCGSSPPATIAISNGGLGGGTACNFNLTTFCPNPNNYWCVQNNANGIYACLIDGSLSPQPVSVGETVTWTGNTGVVLSGPYADAGTCAGVCSTPPSCCGCTEGATLSFTVTAKTGCFTGWPNSGTVTCHDGGWSFPSVTACSGTQQASIGCANSTDPPVLDYVDFEVTAQSGYTCDPTFSAVFLLNDGAGNSCTITVA